MRRTTCVALMLSAALALTACGDDDGAAGCEGLVNKLCRLATGCIQDSASQSDCCFQATSASGGTTTSCRNPAGRGCEMGMVRDVCGDTTKPETLFADCAAALDQASCVKDGAEDVLELPDACKGLLDCNAGPCLN